MRCANVQPTDCNPISEVYVAPDGIIRCCGYCREEPGERQTELYILKMVHL